MNQQTDWAKCSLMIDSSFGTMDYRMWCLCEAARRSAASGVVHKVVRKRIKGILYCCVVVKDGGKS